MTDFKYEIGDELITYAGGTFRRVVQRHKSADGSLHYWVEDEAGHPCTYDEKDLFVWKKIVPFFRVGDTFTAKGTRYKVLYVTEESGKPTALALGRNIQGLKWTESVSEFTYRQVKHKIEREV